MDDDWEGMICAFLLMTTSLGFILGFMLADTIPEGWKAFVTAPIFLLFAISWMTIYKYLKRME